MSVPQVDLGGFECERSAALVAGQEPKAASFADEWDDHERADAEARGEILRQRELAVRVVDEDRVARCERPLERVELRDGKDVRERVDLLRGQPVAGERHERRGLRHVTDDADTLEAEAVGDGGARALEHGARAELTAGERTGERVQRFELDMGLGRQAAPGTRSLRR